MEQFAKPGDFCPNQGCPDYQKLQSAQPKRNIVKAGKTRKGVQRYRYKTCGKYFVETSGTIFYRKRTPEHEILETLALLAEGNRISTLTRVKGDKEDTILKWLREAAQHTAAVEEALMKDFRVKRGQLEGLWLYVGNKGEKNYPETPECGQFIRSTLLDMDSRLRVASAIEKDETQASISVFQVLKRRGHPDAPPPTISDGWGGIDKAMIEVYGLVAEYGGRGSPPTRKKPGKDWLYLQMVKQRDEHGHFFGTKLKAIFDSLEELTSLLGEATAYIERSHLTSRLFNSRQSRKILAFSKNLACCRAAAAWEDAYYNLVKPHKSLRRPVSNVPGHKWIPRTPAMAAALTDPIWSVNELLVTIPLNG